MNSFFRVGAALLPILAVLSLAGCAADTSAEDAATENADELRIPTLPPLFKCLTPDVSQVLPVDGYSKRHISRDPAPTGPFVEFKGCPISVNFDELQRGVLAGKRYLNIHLGGSPAKNGGSWQVSIYAHRTISGDRRPLDAGVVPNQRITKEVAKQTVNVDAQSGLFQPLHLERALDLHEGWESLSISVQAIGLIKSGAGGVPSFFNVPLPVDFKLYLN